VPGLRALAGCATPAACSTWSRHHTVSAAAASRAWWSSEARKIALTAANDHCAQMAKRSRDERRHGDDEHLCAGSAEVTFRCLAKAVATTSVPAYRVGLAPTRENHRDRPRPSNLHARDVHARPERRRRGGRVEHDGCTSGTVSGTVQEGRISAFRAKQVNPGG